MALRETPRLSNALRTLRGTLWNRSTPRTLRRSAALRVLHALRGAPRRSACSVALQAVHTLPVLCGTPRWFACFAWSPPLRGLRGAPRHPATLLAFTGRPWKSTFSTAIHVIPVTPPTLRRLTVLHEIHACSTDSIVLRTLRGLRSLQVTPGRTCTLSAFFMHFAASSQSAFSTALRGPPPPRKNCQSSGGRIVHISNHISTHL